MNSIRTITKVLVIATLATFAVALSVVGAKSQANEPKTVMVTITPANPPTVSPDPAEISKSEGDQVEWTCPDCTSGFTVHFPNGTPFSSSSFDQSHAASGRATANAATGLYHYAVTVNGHTADPGVRVNP